MNLQKSGNEAIVRQLSDTLFGWIRNPTVANMGIHPPMILASCRCFRRFCFLFVIFNAGEKQCKTRRIWQRGTVCLSTLHVALANAARCVWFFHSVRWRTFTAENGRKRRKNGRFCHVEFPIFRFCFFTSDCNQL